MKRGLTRADYEQYVNEAGIIPDDDLKSNGGRIPDGCKYGSWLRRHDWTMFEAGYEEWVMDNEVV